MILQRLANSIRKQDWFTVFIETLIVVLGVFVGLQVNNWNEARQARGKEALYLSDLIDDLNADLGEIDQVRRTAEIRMGALEQVLALVKIEPRRTLTYDGRSFTFDQAPPFHSDDPYEGNAEITATPHLDGSRETFQALISTGDIGLIRDRRLTRQVQTYYADMTEVNSLEESIHDVAETVNDSRRRLGASLTGRVTIEDLGALAAGDPQFRAELETYWTASAFQVRAMNGLRREAEALIDAIEVERKK